MFDDGSTLDVTVQNVCSRVILNNRRWRLLARSPADPHLGTLDRLRDGKMTARVCVAWQRTRSSAWRCGYARIAPPFVTAPSTIHGPRPAVPTILCRSRDLVPGC
jgi:hypothetical protein